MRKYPKYKETEVIWVKTLPETWKELRVKYFSIFRNGYSFKGTDFYDDEKYPVVRIGDIQDGKVNLSDAKKVSKKIYEEAKKFSNKRGDILLALTGATIGKSAIYDTDEISLLNQRVAALRPNKKADIDFLKYLIEAPEFKTLIDFECYGGAQENIGKGQITSAKFPIPSLSEQHAIVRFLDFKTGQIDSFIANRQKQIELLKEQKKYILDKRITEGIYPEKGFQKIVHPYIKQIPVGWEFKKLAFLSKITRLAGYEYTLFWEPQEDGEVIALRGQNVGFNELKDIENAERISKELSLRLNRSKLYKDDIVFPCVGTVGKAVLIEEDDKYHINQNIAKITPKIEVDGLFLSLLLNSYYAYHQIIHFNTSDAQPNVLVRDLRRFMIPTPPFEEQKEIARVIIKELYTLNTIISKYKKQIDLMQEYRTSLISQAVTGKIDVRDWKPKMKA